MRAEEECGELALRITYIAGQKSTAKYLEQEKFYYGGGAYCAIIIIAPQKRENAVVPAV